MLVGCSSDKLSEEEQTFTTNKQTYTFQLPEGWEMEENYQTVFNQAAVFGAMDTNSTGMMFIRPTDQEPMSEEALTTWVTEQAAAQDIEVTPENVSTETTPIVFYTTTEAYKRKDMWSHRYYVSTDSEVLECRFYSPKDGSDEKRQKLFEQVVQSIQGSESEDKGTTKESSSSQALTGKAENEDLMIQVLGADKVEEGGQQLLVVRYAFRNKGTTAIVPAEEWGKAVTVTQGETTLAVQTESPATLSSENQLLVTAGQTALNERSATEAAAIYSLKDAGSAIKVSFNEELFPGVSPVLLELGESN